MDEAPAASPTTKAASATMERSIGEAKRSPSHDAGTASAAAVTAIPAIMVSTPNAISMCATTRVNLYFIYLAPRLSLWIARRGVYQTTADRRSWPRGSSMSYSITRSAWSSSVCGIVSLSAFAVLRLTASSNLVGCCTGKSAGLAPLRILSTYTAACRH